MEESYKKVSFQEAKHIIDTEPNCVILDVRDEDEYITGHAENAVLFPVDTIDEDTAEEKIPTLDTPILVYCKSGRRSSCAACPDLPGTSRHTTLQPAPLRSFHPRSVNR